jgi:hypothetical protein
MVSRELMVVRNTIWKAMKAFKWWYMLPTENQKQNSVLHVKYDSEN